MVKEKEDEPTDRNADRRGIWRRQAGDDSKISLRNMGGFCQKQCKAQHLCLLCDAD